MNETKKPITKLSLTNEYGTYTVELDRSVDGIHDFFELVRSVALAAGWSESSIDEHLGD